MAPWELRFDNDFLPLEFTNLKSKFGDTVPFLDELVVLTSLLDLVFILQRGDGRLMLSYHRRVLLQFGARGGEFGFELASNLILLPFGGGEFHLAPCFQLIQARSQCRDF